MTTLLLTIATLALAAAQTPDDSAGAWLERIEARAAQIDTLGAKITYTTIQGLLGDRQTRIGTLIYDDADEGKPTRFAVRFDRIVLDGSMQMQDRSYIFDGMWLGERIRDGGRKIFIRRQLVAPHDRDAEEDLLGLGEGPFALPLNLKKDQVLRKYEVSVIEPEEGDPEDAVHLRLIPRPGVQIEQERIDLWFGRETLLPVRARTANHDETESIITLREVRVNPTVEGEPFDTTPPSGAGWQIEIKPLEAS